MFIYEGFNPDSCKYLKKEFADERTALDFANSNAEEYSEFTLTDMRKVRLIFSKEIDDQKREELLAAIRPDLIMRLSESLNAMDDLIKNLDFSDN